MWCVVLLSITNVTADEMGYIYAHDMSYVYEYLLVDLIGGQNLSLSRLGFQIRATLPSDIILVKVASWCMS